MLLALLSAIVAVHVVVFFRGAGRFLAARLTGRPVTSVVVGLGRVLFAWTSRRGTRWSIGPLLIGGYVVCAPAGPHGRDLASRAVVLAAGPAANFALAVLLFTGLHVFVGVPTFPPVVHDVTANGAGARAGLKPGDRIVSLDGTTLDSFGDLVRIVQARPGERIVLQVQRGATNETLPVQVDSQEVDDRAGNHTRIGMIGIGAQYALGALEHRRLSLPRALSAGANQAFDKTAHIARIFLQVIGYPREAGSPNGGPLRIAQVNRQTEDQIAGFVYLVALLSITFLLFNLLPLSMLDGGKLILTAIEAIRKEPLAPRVQQNIFRISVAILVGASLLVLWNLLYRLEAWRWFAGLTV